MSVYQQSLKQTPTAKTANKPIAHHRAGVISVSVWENAGKEFDGKPSTFLTFSIQRSYKDPKTGEWAHTDSYRKNDLPVLVMLLGKAFEAAVTSKKEEGE